MTTNLDEKPTVHIAQSKQILEKYETIGRKMSQVFYVDTYCLNVFRPKKTVTEKVL